MPGAPQEEVTDAQQEQEGQQIEQHAHHGELMGGEDGEGDRLLLQQRQEPLELLLASEDSLTEIRSRLSGAGPVTPRPFLPLP